MLIDYEIESLDEEIYICTLKIDHKLPLYNMLFTLLKKATNLNESDIKDTIDINPVNSTLNIDPMYKKQLKVSIKSVMNNIKKDMQRDKVKLLDYDIIGLRFNKVNDKYDIMIDIRGLYTQS